MPDKTPAYRQDILFSSFYLDKLLPNDDRWEKDQSRVEDVFKEVRQLYQKNKDYLEKASEADTEQEFIEPLLKLLGFSIMPQPMAPVGGSPDYALYASEGERGKSQRGRGKPVDFSLALGVLEGKYWDRSLDRGKADDERDIDKSRRTNPKVQLTDYLFRTGCNWGVLTNGVEWRLFHREKSGRRVTNYFGVNLLKILEEGTAEDFAYFYNLFRREAFERDNGKCLLDRALNESLEYARGVEENLKENVYRALRILSEGFFSDAPGRLDRSSEEHRKLVHDNALIFLYRLLFIFYAESPREGQYLLPIGLRDYRDWYSLEAVKRDIRRQDDPESAFSRLHHTLWEKVNVLFNLIDEGSKKRGIPEDQFVVPPYNGRLFDANKYSFLNEHRVSDAHLWRVIDLLAHARDPKTGDREPVAYSNLDVRHLGSIYEGLLEHKLVVADEEMACIRNEWIPATKAEGKRSKVEDRAAPGELYPATDKGERKASGSYYTPDYIVKYIVEQTLNPLIGEKRKLVEERVHDLEAKVKLSRGRNRKEYEKQLAEARESIIDEILSIRVLDPAMGSGHFLVEVTDYLARALVGELGVKAEELTEDDIRWARREVVEKCIYGVDLNPLAVELAKLSLWLSTVSVNKPLSFLDHNLHEGNSLIGAHLEEMADLPDPKKGKKPKAGVPQMSIFEYVFRQQVHSLLDAYRQITDLPSETVEDIKKKEEQYAYFNQKLERFRQVANCWVSVHFGNQVHWDDYNCLQEGLRDEAEWKRISSKKFFKRAQTIATERRFFHWELEFPEIFYEKDRRKENPGFDCVVGNPPYVRQEGLGDLKPYFKGAYRAYHGVADLYVYFYERSHELLRREGRFGMITSNKFFRSNYGGPLRTYLRDSIALETIADFHDLPVFEDATTYPCVVVSQQNGARGEPTTFVHVPSEDFEPLLHNLKSLEHVVAERGHLLPETAFAGYNWSLTSTEEAAILEKVQAIGVQLGEYVNHAIRRGVLTGFNEAFFIDHETRERLIAEDSKSAEIIKPLVLGEDIKRYEIDYKNRYLIFSRRGLSIKKYPAIERYLSKWKADLTPKKRSGQPGPGRKPGNYKWHEIQDSIEYYKDFEKPKIVYQEIATYQAFAYSREPLFTNNKCFIIPTSNIFVLSLLNAKLSWHFLRSTISALRGGAYALQTPYMESLPIRRIHFTTPKAERNRLAKRLVGFYEGDNFDKLLAEVEKLLPKDKEGNFLAFKKGGLGAKEKSDVVHDLVAHLAQEMLDLHKEKQQEIKGFLKWFEDRISKPIEELSRKTTIKNYHEQESYRALIEVLKHNRKALNFDSETREFSERIEREFNRSLTNLNPLKERIQATDRLIDQIVYLLYGLTEGEISIVEASLPP